MTSVLISIHALREEGDGAPPASAGSWKKFLSTPSARRATLDQFLDGIHISISIHALREEGDLQPQQGQRGKPISIHALREEGDAAPLLFYHILLSISIHALREEGDRDFHRASSFRSDFYPRPPRGGRQLPLL